MVALKIFLLHFFLKTEPHHAAQTVSHLASQYFLCLSFLDIEIARVSPHFLFLSLLLILLFTSEQKEPTLCCPCNVIDMTLNWKLARGTQRSIKRFLLSEKCDLC